MGGRPGCLASSCSCVSLLRGLASAQATADIGGVCGPDFEGVPIDMAGFLRHRLTGEEGGFTLIELLVVIVILGILLAIAVPSYLSFRGRANVSAAKANVRAAVPGMEAFNADHATGYAGVTLTKLQQSYDAGIKNVKIVRANSTSYCIQNTSPGTVSYHKGGPSSDIVAGVC